MDVACVRPKPRQNYTENAMLIRRECSEKSEVGERDLGETRADPDSLSLASSGQGLLTN
jgi:hypothetical protein